MISIENTQKALDAISRYENLCNARLKQEDFCLKFGIKPMQFNFLLAVVANERKERGLQS